MFGIDFASFSDILWAEFFVAILLIAFFEKGNEMFRKLFVLVVFVFMPPAIYAAADNNSPTGPPVTETAFAKAFGTTGDTISSNMGGEGNLFLDAAKEILRTGRHIKIDGWCRSSCVIFADKARPNVCITANVVFGFHMGTYEDTGERVPMPISDDLRAWVLNCKGWNCGGFPYQGYLQMSTKQASAFWPMCK